MSLPLYSTQITPVKNIFALLAYLGLTPIRQTAQSESAQAIMDLARRAGCHDLLPTDVTTAGAGTYTAAQFATGFVRRDPNGANRTDTTPAATALIAAIPALAVDYGEAYVTLYNNADAAETITLAAGSGVTLQGSITCSQSAVIRLRITRTSSTTVAIGSC